MTTTKGYFSSDPDYSAQTLRGDLQIGSEYQEKFNKSYQDSYFDSMYGESWNETFTDDEGEERSKKVRKFNIQSGLSPSFADETNLKGNIQKDLQKLQNKNREKIAKIDQATGMYNLMGLAFS